MGYFPHLVRYITMRSVNELSEIQQLNSPGLNKTGLGYFGIEIASP